MRFLPSSLIPLLATFSAWLISFFWSSGNCAEAMFAASVSCRRFACTSSVVRAGSPAPLEAPAWEPGTSERTFASYLDDQACRRRIDPSVLEGDLGGQLRVTQQLPTIDPFGREPEEGPEPDPSRLDRFQERPRWRVIFKPFVFA
jgi:hypothetical protein